MPLKVCIIKVYLFHLIQVQNIQIINKTKFCWNVFWSICDISLFACSACFGQVIVQLSSRALSFLAFSNSEIRLSSCSSSVMVMATFLQCLIFRTKMRSLKEPWLLATNDEHKPSTRFPELFSHRHSFFSICFTGYTTWWDCLWFKQTETSPGVFLLKA